MHICFRFIISESAFKKHIGRPLATELQNFIRELSNLPATAVGDCISDLI